MSSTPSLSHALEPQKGRQKHVWGHKDSLLPFPLSHLSSWGDFLIWVDLWLSFTCFLSPNRFCSLPLKSCLGSGANILTNNPQVTENPRLLCAKIGRREGGRNVPLHPAGKSWETFPKPLMTLGHNLTEKPAYSNTDIFGYSNPGYSDTPLTLTVLVNPMLPKSVTVSKYLLTVTLFLCPRLSQ